MERASSSTTGSAPSSSSSVPRTSPHAHPAMSTSSTGSISSGGSPSMLPLPVPMTQDVSPATATRSLSGATSPSSLKRGLDDLLLFFARCPVEQNYPRPTVGVMHMYKGGPALTVQSEEHITRVFAKLVSEGFLSAPVLDDHRRFLGFVDMLDIATFTVKLFEKEKLDWNAANWEVFWTNLGTFREARVKDVMSDLPGTNQSIKRGFSLLHAMETMARTGAHRVAVLDDHDQVVGLSTESMIVSLLSQNVSMLGAMKETRIRDAHASLCSPVVSVKESQRAIEAFRIMSEKRVSGLAVLNARDCIVDVISARDLRCIGTDGANWWRLFETVHTFKALSRMKFPQQTPRRPLYVHENDTIARVMEQMDDGNIHRVFEVAEVPRESGTSEDPIGMAHLGGGVSMTHSLRAVHVISQHNAIRYVLRLLGMPSAASASPTMAPSSPGRAQHHHAHSSSAAGTSSTGSPLRSPTHAVRTPPPFSLTGTTKPLPAASSSSAQQQQQGSQSAGGGGEKEKDCAASVCSSKSAKDKSVPLSASNLGKGYQSTTGSGAYPPIKDPLL